MSNIKFSKPLWHLIDARNQIVGRLATQIAHILRGKHKPNFTPNYDCGDYVVVINAKEVKFTGRKLKNKLYTWHTGYPGGLKQMSAEKLLDRKPEEVIVLFHSAIYNIFTLLKPGTSQGCHGNVCKKQPEKYDSKETEDIPVR